MRKKILAGLAIAGACVAGLMACLAVLIFVLEHNRVQSLCRLAESTVASVGDAINAMRNYRAEDEVVGRMLAAVRQTDAFQRDGYKVETKDEGGYRYREGGGWQVETWTTPLNRGYTVSFDYRSPAYPQIAVTCVVYDCGGIDIPNCLTLGGYEFFPVPGNRTWVSPTTG